MATYATKILLKKCKPIKSSSFTTPQLNGSKVHDQTDLPVPFSTGLSTYCRVETNARDRRDTATQGQHAHRHGRVKQQRGACAELLVVWEELLDAWRNRGSITEQSMCLRSKTTVLTRRNYYTYPVNLLGPVPKHLSAFYINETERFGHFIHG